MRDVYIVQCLMETDLYKLLKTQVRVAWNNQEVSMFLELEKLSFEIFFKKEISDVLVWNFIDALFMFRYVIAF